MDMVENENIKGYKVYTETICTQNKDGTWKVTQLVSQSKSVDGEKWEDRFAQVSAINKTISAASIDAFNSMATYLQTIDNDLFNATDEKNTEGKTELLQ
jgi:hypothetical protein